MEEKNDLSLTEKEGSVRFAVHAKPRAKRSAIVGVSQGALEVALAAPPVDGAANDELVRFLSKTLRIPKRDVTLMAGEGSRHKRIAVTGLTPAELLHRLGLPDLP
jgi:uncharacterized protein (TIGR00251 family)